ncbi:MAG: hypothetical protein C0614_06995 [Desulfuromonas sp.]|nr:MAG: hypothetical protein C0614_06995 [Desulfuromonas sp.]
MSEQLTGIEEKLIEFATKASATIQSQSEQIHALTHALLIALVAMSEQNQSFREDFLERIGWVSEHHKDHSTDTFTQEFFAELIRFLEDPYNYSTSEDGRPKWFKGIISGGRSPSQES